MDDFTKAIRGRVLAPGDDTFETARLPWNRAVDQGGVRLVVVPEDAADAAAAVRCARMAGLTVATQPNGHGAAGGLDGEVLLRTHLLRGVEVDPVRRIARVEAGASWGEVQAAAAKHGLSGPCGSSPVVSATGYLLGGGLSWFGRAHGFGASGVRAFDVVDADGHPARVTGGSDPDLFWALRGGGGDFALVTAVEIELFPAPSIFGGRLLWPSRHAPDVLAAFREATREAPDELSLWFNLLEFPPFPEVPEPVRGLSAVVLDLAFLGGEAEGRALTDRLAAIPGLMIDSRRPLRADEMGSICDEPTDPGASLFSGQILTGLPDDAAATILSAPGGPMVSVQVRHLGGAIARSSDDHGAHGRIAEPYLLGLLGVAPAPPVAEIVRARQAEISRALVPYTTGRKPFTYLSPGEKAAAAFPAGTLARLREIKRRRDPHGTFRSNFPVLA
ncbi:FAD-binding oxidoreductase [Herbidospora galbida]|uniref:FAD-binding oxidoreductase n=1 Tax=Herbidospora galbida TaxID=2575442 RepID=A0A4U3MI85_9ACTN|nr:FAD-binding oxidoreductase [Herbidospora galbida]TKK89075.1 FAD-binding oxidoreductase [Herbidospora galbida]